MTGSGCGGDGGLSYTDQLFREVSDAVFGDDDDDDDLFRAVSNRDSEVTDEVLEEGSDDEPASSSLTCGVPRCPNANTQWPSKERLEKHR
jgi:hypothetical protein